MLTNTDLQAREFEALAGLAGQFLEHARGFANSRLSQILDEPNPKIRWFRLLEANGGTFTQSGPAFQSSDDGSDGAIYSGSIGNPAGASATLCVYLAAHHPLKDMRTITQRLVDDHLPEIVRAALIFIVTGLLGLVGTLLYRIAIPVEAPAEHSHAVTDE
ncbi:hypothetical protein [Thioalkalivibrio sp.]|uniref:hypothetical protein n=1 Tax=Thioalkalivibrio sp. TaxID=2093813 RepID=UPI0035635973